MRINPTLDIPIILVDLMIMGAPSVFPAIPDLIGQLMFWGAAFLLVAYSLFRSFGMFSLPSWFGQQPLRIPLLELRDIAKDQGWDFGDQSLEGMDLADAIQQGAVDRIFKMWGKPDRNDFTSLTKKETLQVIDADLWSDLTIDAGAIYAATDNFETVVHNLRQKDIKQGSYVDLHLERRPALKWLKREARQYKGRRDAETKSR